MRSLIVLMVVFGLASMASAAGAAKPAAKPEKPAKAPKTPEELAKEAADRAKKLAEEVQKVEAALPEKATVKPEKPRKLLVFTLTKGFPHDSVPLAAKTFELMGKKTGAFEATVSDDPKVFQAETLNGFDAVMMDNTTGQLFEDEGLKKALVDFVKGGKGLAGIHAATDCFSKWPEYGEMMGAFFAGHPFSKIVVKNDDPTNPINAAFKGQGFEITDEMYTFRDPYSRDKLRILLSIDMEKINLPADPNRPGFKKGENRNDHDYAISWIHEYGKGRAFYCSFGHQHQIFWNPAILQHYLDGIQYVLGDLKADATPTNKLKAAARSQSEWVRGSAGDNQLKAGAAPAGGALTDKPAPKPPTKPATPPAAWVKGADLPPMKVGEFNDLLNGKDLSGWQYREGSWKVEEGGVLAPQKGGDIWTTLRFGDFVLDLEFRTDPNSGGNSGVFLRCDKISDWLNTAFEIQVINSKAADKHSCGSLYDCLAPTKNTVKAPGEWNRYVMTFKGNLLTIELNGEKIIDCNLDDWKEAGKNPDGSKNKFKYAYKDMAKDGFVGLQYHGNPVWYRNIKIKPLTEPKKPEEKVPAEKK